MTVTVTTDGPSGAAIDTRLTLLTLVTNMCREVGLPDPLKIVGSNGAASIDDFISAIVYAIKSNIKIINLT